MKNLTNKELLNIDGGGFKIGIGILIVAGITFIAGVVDGIIRPLKCN